MVALHPTTTADVDTRKHMDLHLCDSSRGSWMHIPFCRLAHAHADNSSGNVIVGLAEASTRRQLAFG